MFKKTFVLLPILFILYGGCVTQPTASDQKAPELKKLELHQQTAWVCFRSDLLEKIINRAWERDSQNKINGFYFAQDLHVTGAEFDSLSPKDKFIFAHQYPETYIQNCGSNEVPEGMTYLYAYIPSEGEGMHMSERQKKSLSDNRDLTIRYLKECIDFNSHIPLSYKQTILDLNIWEFIPSILALENKINKNDKEAVQDVSLYSLLMQMMEQNNFSEFKKASFYKALYGPDSEYGRIEFTPLLRTEIVNLTNSFYQIKLVESQ